MTLKIPWEQDEAVILLDALIKVRNGELVRKDAINIVSKELRQRAINKGIIIDNVFRNINGIGYQMSCMEYVLTNNKKKMMHAAAIFRKAVALYNEDRKAFERILEHTKQEINNTKEAIEDDKNINNENVQANRSAFKNWLKAKGKEYVFILNMSMFLEQCSYLVIKLELSDTNLFLIKDVEKLIELRDALKENCEKYLLSEKQVEKFITALNNYIEFRNGGQSEVITGQKPVVKDSAVEEQIYYAENGTNNKIDLQQEESKDYDKFEIILKEYFPNGFRSNSIDKGRFRKFYLERFGLELLEDDEFIIERLNEIGVQRESRIFAKNDENQQQIIKQIIYDIDLTFSNEATCIYFEAIWIRYQKILSEKLGIYNGSTLAELLQKEFKEKYVFYHNKYFCTYDRQADPYQDVFNCLKQYDTPVTYEQIFKDVWYLPPEKIKQILSTNRIFVCTARKTYFYAPNLPVSENELEQIIAVIATELENRSYISDVDLYDLLEEKCPMVLVNTADFSPVGLRNVLGYLLREEFTFSGKIITLKDQQISLTDVFAEYCSSHDTLTLADIKNFAQEMETTINWNLWNIIRQNMLRISETYFIQFNAVNFDVPAIDDMLDSICVNDYVPVQNVGLFMHFPPIGLQWNSYVLESYVYNISKKFCLINASFTEHGCYGAVVRKNSVFVDYQKLIVDALAHSLEWNNSDEALTFLVREGYQASKRFANIDTVVKEAKLLREQLEKS